MGGTKLGISLAPRLDPDWVQFIQHIITACCLCWGSLLSQAGVYSADSGQAWSGFGLQLSEGTDKLQIWSTDTGFTHTREAQALLLVLL